METVIVDANNTFITLAQGLWSDPKARSVVTDIDAMRRMIITYIAKQMGLGNTVILCVDSGSWRKKYFKEYKARRREERQKSDFPYDEFMPVYQAVIDEIKETPGAVQTLQVPGCEGDDIIAVMAALMQPCVIHSTDRDLLQLQTFYSDVRQFSPRDWKYMTPQDKGYDLLEHVIRGDSGDGVPNVLSADDCFVTRTRQTVMTKSRFENLYSVLSSPDPDAFLRDDPVLAARIARNRLMIDLREIPDDIVRDIIAAYEALPQGKTGNFSNLMLKYGIVI